MKGIPKGCGRKGGRAPPKKKKMEPIRERVELTPIMTPPADVQCTNSRRTTSVHVSDSNQIASPFNFGITDTLVTSESTICNPVPCAAPMNSSISSFHFPYAAPVNPSLSLCHTPYTAPMNPSLSSHLSMYTTPITSSLSLHHSMLPVMPFSPWCNSSYNNNNVNQTVQQFLSPSVFASPVVDNPQKFFVRFIVGNISVCYGCRNRYSKNAKPPDDLCLQTEEWRQYTPTGSLLPQSHWANTYYHMHVNCVRLRWKMFDPQTQVIVDDIKDRLLCEHKEKILKELGLTI